MSNRKIHISDKKNRNALIDFKGFTPQKNIVYVDSNSKPISNQKYIKSTVDEDYDTLLKKYKEPNEVAKAIMDADPDINMEMAGRFLERTSRVYINEEQKIVFKINKNELVYNHKNELVEEREPRHLEANINLEKPLMWSGKLFPKTEAFKKFVFARKYQLKHTNGLTFDMLYNIAQELHESKSLMLIGSGKGTGPVVFQDGGNPFRVFLEGRVQGEQYLLLMHLSNQELKSLN